MKKGFVFFSTLIITAALCIVSFSGCNGSFTFNGITDYSYADADKYVVGEAVINQNVSNLNLSWISGNVSVESYSGSVITVSEDYDNSDENMRMRYFLDGETLRVKFCKSGSWNLNNFNKNLIVRVPEDSEFESVTFNSISANLKCDLPSCNLENLKIDSVSGALHINAGKIDSMNVSTVSGGFEAIIAEGFVNLTANTVSGTVYTATHAGFGNVDVNTVSGTVTLSASQNVDLTVDFSTVSGDFISAFRYDVVNNKYVFGSGTAFCKISTVSGDVVISEFTE